MAEFAKKTSIFMKVSPFQKKRAEEVTSLNSGEIILCEEDQAAFLATLRNPPAPGPRLVAAYKGYKDRAGS